MRGNSYVDQAGNLAAFVRIDDTGDMDFTTFSAQPVCAMSLHPCSKISMLISHFPLQHPDVRPMAYAGGFGGLGGLL
jgi:serine/threonine-protein phosphatase 5